MKLLAALLVVLWVASTATAQTTVDHALDPIEAMVDDLAAPDVPDLPELFLHALAEAEAPGHFAKDPVESRLTTNLARILVPADKPLMAWRLEVLAAHHLLARRFDASEIAALYAEQAYFGRNCHGYDAAISGLVGTAASEADETVWLALAVLPGYPGQLNDAEWRAERVATVIASLTTSGYIDAAEASRLAALPPADLSAGPGCFP